MTRYDLTCPVCRTAHTIEATFLSSPRSLVATDGRTLPAMSCGNHHTAAEVAAMRER